MEGNNWMAATCGHLWFAALGWTRERLHEGAWFKSVQATVWGPFRQQEDHDASILVFLILLFVTAKSCPQMVFFFGSSLSLDFLGWWTIVTSQNQCLPKSAPRGCGDDGPCPGSSTFAFTGESWSQPKLLWGVCVNDRWCAGKVVFRTGSELQLEMLYGVFHACNLSYLWYWYYFILFPYPVYHCTAM